MTFATSFGFPFALIGGLGLPEIAVIGFILVFLFGAAKLPKLARSVGESITEFKKGVKGEGDDDKLPAGDDPKKLPKDD